VVLSAIKRKYRLHILYTVAGYREEVQLCTKGKRHRSHFSNININSNVLPKTVYNRTYAVTGQRAKMCP
jgi:hypothetical protein